MSDQERGEEQVPLGQVIFDEWYLLFLVSVVLSFVLYNAWGLMELLRLPISQ
jgi:hypothetical protein